MLLPFRNPTDAPEDGAAGLPGPLPQVDGENTRSRRLRREKIQRLADEAAEQWQERHGPAALPTPTPPTRLFETLPRPPSLGVTKGEQSALPPRRREEVFKAGVFRTSYRLLLWIYAAWRFFLAVVRDKITGQDSEKARAVRLRKTFEAMGMTFIKIGQQLSMRLDLLPYAYTRELEKMLDSVPPMPPELAIETIERASGKPLDEIYASFDPDPIGSASVACVYQAVLLTGERVAVKVRRAGIGELLAADMRALSWLLHVVELFLLRPGFTGNFMYELSTMLMDELDFIREARFNELFRRRMRKARQLRFATAPKIYFEQSSVEVLVAEFLTGVWLTEVLAALENDDQEAICKLDEMGIDPLILARRIQMIARFNNFENIFFHADLHPANVLVQPGNRIVLIDFGSCGSFSKKELNSWRRWFDAQSTNDVGGMVQAALAIIEPLPPIDRDSFGLKLETMFWNDLYAIKSKHSEWYERISARLWFGFLKLSREFGVPMRLNTLRMIRASMLADTLAARLDPDQDPYSEYRHYERGAGRRARRRLLKRLRRLCGPGKFVRFEQGLESGLKFFYRIQRSVDSLASIGIIPLIGKAAETASLVIRLLFNMAGFAAAWATVILVNRVLTHAPANTRVFLDIWKYVVLDNGYYQVLMLIPIVITARRIVIRLRDQDYDPPRGDAGNTNVL